MGVPEHDVERWIAACGVQEAVSADHGASTAHTTAPAGAVDAREPGGPAPAAAAGPEREVLAPPDPTVRQALGLVLACLAVNILGREFVDFFNLPVHLDMVGTAIAAIALGPWRGAGVGAATNVLGMVGSGWTSLPLALRRRFPLAMLLHQDGPEHYPGHDQG